MEGQGAAPPPKKKHENVKFSVAGYFLHDSYFFPEECGQLFKLQLTPQICQSHLQGNGPIDPEVRLPTLERLFNVEDFFLFS
jgi:hypothetical protein